MTTTEAIKRLQIMRGALEVNISIATIEDQPLLVLTFQQDLEALEHILALLYKRG